MTPLVNFSEPRKLSIPRISVVQSVLLFCYTINLFPLQTSPKSNLSQLPRKENHDDWFSWWLFLFYSIRYLAPLCTGFLEDYPSSEGQGEAEGQGTGGRWSHLKKSLWFLFFTLPLSSLPLNVSPATSWVWLCLDWCVYIAVGLSMQLLSAFPVPCCDKPDLICIWLLVRDHDSWFTYSSWGTSYDRERTSKAKLRPQ